MRVLSAVLACAVLASCLHNPTPARITVHDVQRKGYGSYVEITKHSGDVLRGELLAVDGDVLSVVTLDERTESVALDDVQAASLYTYESDWGFGIWGLLGVLSTVSHGVLLVFSVPIWILASSATAIAESTHIRLRFTEHDDRREGLDTFRKWARYPQGMPKAAARRREPPPPAEDAWTLTKHAQAAARADKCDQVRGLEPRVRALDAGLHEATFMRDEAIRRCLGLPSLLPSPSGVPVDAGVPAPDAGTP